MTKRTLFSLLAAVALTMLTVPPQRIANVFASPQPQTLIATVPAIVASGNAQLIGPSPSSDVLTISLGLSLRDRAALLQFNHDLSDPTSPDYHRYLSQAEANQLFNPSLAQEQQVSNWLQANGLTATRTYPNHVMLDATGTVRQIQTLLHVTINEYRAIIRGQERIFSAPDRNPTIDATVSGVVNSINGLDTLPRFHHSLVGGNAHGSAPFYPQDFAHAYDVGALWGAGATGSSQHIGITLWEVPPPDTTLNHFGSVTGAAVATRANGRLHITAIDGGTTYQDDGEAGLDTEYTSSMAPNATIDYYEAPTDAAGNPSNQGLLDAMNLAGTDSANNRVISSSWGGCEAGSATDPWTVAAETIFATNTATGHNYVFSSGDNASWCDPNQTGTGIDPYPDYPASSPNVTSVGGTRLAAHVGTTYPGETTWSYCASCGGSPEGSGGGYSTIFARPAWQSATTGLLTNGMRGYPDIAADADPASGAYMCWGVGSCTQVGGTSLSAPLWAAFATDVNSYLVARGKPALGFLASTLYGLAGSAITYSPFHDTVSGSNGGFNAGIGWDAVTGWGSPDVWNLARDLAVGVSGGPAPTSTPTPTATNTTAPDPTATATPAPNAGGNLITNGDFERGAYGWTEHSGSGRELVTSTQAHGGTQSAWFCGYNSCLDQLSQNFKVPTSVGTATLTYWVHSDTTDTVSCTDSLSLQLRYTTGAALVKLPRQCNANIAWQLRTVNLSSLLYAHQGQSLQIFFQGITDTVNPSDFYVDDLSLTTTAPTTTPTATPTATATSSVGAGTCPGTQSACQQSMLAILNADRAANGVAPLTLNLAMSNGSGSCIGSYGHSVHMASLGAISHDQFPADVCYPYQTAGENVGEAGYGNELTDMQQLDQMMMAEPHDPATCASTYNHACNTINSHFHQVGIGIYHSPSNQTWLTEDFSN